MKKIGLLLSVIIVLTGSCADKNAFTLTSEIKNAELDGEKVYLQRLSKDGMQFNTIDSAVIKNSKFVFKGKAEDKPAVLFATIANSQYSIPNIFILEAGKINMTIDSVTTVGGTPLNDSYQELSTKKEKINARMKALGEEYRQLAASGKMLPEDEERIQGMFEENVKELSNIVFEFTKSNMTNPVGEFFFKNVGNTMGEDQLRELLTLANPEFKQDKQIQLLDKQLTALKNTAIGQPFIDIKAQSPDSSVIALSDYAGKGKVVLIDFWASWCGPCILEMPNVVEAYKKYKGKGLEIVGVSLDESAGAWKEAIKKHSMTWPQMSDLKGWNSELSAAYGVTGIPHTVLLDKEGKIIKKNLRGEDLLSALDELLK